MQKNTNIIPIILTLIGLFLAWFPIRDELDKWFNKKIILPNSVPPVTDEDRNKRNSTQVIIKEVQNVQNQYIEKSLSILKEKLAARNDITTNSSPSIFIITIQNAYISNSDIDTNGDIQYKIHFTLTINNNTANKNSTITTETQGGGKKIDSGLILKQLSENAGYTLFDKITGIIQ